MPILLPADIPLKIRYGSSLTFGLEGSKAVTEMERGPKLRRERYTNVPFIFNMVATFNDAQFEAFKSFYIQTTKMGTLPFMAPVLVGESIETRKVYIDNEQIEATSETYTKDGTRWQVPLTFEVRGEFIVPYGVFWYFSYYGDEVGNEIVDTLDYIVNVQYPIVAAPY